VIIPDLEISAIGKGYVSPAVKSFTATELERLFSPDNVTVAFSDLLIMPATRSLT
jgi:hypothetical protein